MIYGWYVKVRIHLRQKLINLINLHKVEHITSREAQEAQGTQRTQAVDVNASALNLMLCPKQLTRKRRCLCGAFVTRRGAWAPWVEKSWCNQFAKKPKQMAQGTQVAQAAVGLHLGHIDYLDYSWCILTLKGRWHSGRCPRQWSMQCFIFSITNNVSTKTPCMKTIQ